MADTSNDNLLEDYRQAILQTSSAREIYKICSTERNERIYKAATDKELQLQKDILARMLLED